MGVLATGSLARTSPSRITTHARCDDFPTSSPMTISGLLGGAMVVSSNRQIDRKPSLRHPHYLAVAPAPGSFLSVVRSGERLRWQRPPRSSSGAGAGGHPEAPDWRPLGACPYRRQCAECSPPKFIGGLSRTVMGSAPSVGVVASVPSTVSAADSVPSPVDSPSLATVSSLGVSTASLEGSSGWMTSSSGCSSVASSAGTSSIVAASPVLTASSIAGC